MSDEIQHLDANASQGGVFCRECGYSLTGLLESRCPECGREFDLNNARTIARRPPRSRVRRWTLRVVGVAFLSILVAGVGAGWLRWEWSVEQKAIGQLRGSVLTSRERIVIKPVGPDYLRTLMGKRFDYLLDRVTEVTLSDKEPGELEAIDFKALKHLEVLRLYACDLSETACARIAEATSLREIDLIGVEIKGAGLGSCRALPHLEKLRLVQTQVNKEIIVQVSELKGLKVLQIDCVEIPSSGQLGKLVNLEELSVAGSGLRETEIECMNDMRLLRRLDVRETRASSKQIATLRKALPDLKVRSNYQHEW